MTSFDILCSDYLNFSNEITEILKLRKNISKYFVTIKIFKNISKHINRCLKYFMTSAKIFPPPPRYLMYNP